MYCERNRIIYKKTIYIYKKHFNDIFDCYIKLTQSLNKILCNNETLTLIIIAINVIFTATKKVYLNCLANNLSLCSALFVLPFRSFVVFKKCFHDVHQF